MPQVRTFAYTLFCLFCINCLNAQMVNEVKYQIKYNQEDCLFDAFVIIHSGSATNPFFRTQFSSQFSIVTPSSANIVIEENYMPLKNNQNYTGTEPTEWTIFNFVSNSPDFPGKNVFSIGPSLNPSSQYNDLSPGDTIKIFSFSINVTIDCASEIRPYDNENDPEDIDNSDWKNSFSVGPTQNQYIGNEDYVGPSIAPLLDTTIISGSEILIDITTDEEACQTGYTYKWTLPNGSIINSQDVSITNPEPSDYGFYALEYSNVWQCKDTVVLNVISQEIITFESSNHALKLQSSFEHISAHLDFSGDDNKNSTFLLEYKVKGTNEYKLASTSMRAYPELIVDGNQLNKNFHAASAMHLLPNTHYDIRVTFIDEDGGTEIFTSEIKTKKYPEIGNSGNVIYVSPGNEGGNGTESNPYLGIQTAIDECEPGQIILLNNGEYNAFACEVSGTEENPIIIKSLNLHGAIINGNNTSTGIITIGTSSDSTKYIQIEGLQIKNGKWGIDAQNTQFVTIRNNKIYDVDYGFVNRRENGWEHNQLIYNNEFTGKTTWPQLNGNIPSERAIDIRGNNNTISYNSISNFGDGISTDGMPYEVSYGLDIHNNFITKVVDDAIEVDGMVSNTRVYENVVINARAGISLAPVFGGPAYIFRNQFYNLENSTFKLNRSPAGLIIVNNSFAKSENGMSSPSGWQNIIFKNNVNLAEDYCFEEYELAESSMLDWDNNAYKSLRSGNSAEPWFKWDNTQFENIGDLANNSEIGDNSIETSVSDFINMSIPTVYGNEASYSGIDFHPKPSASLINQGISFVNLNDPYVQDGLTDIGALELGSDLIAGSNFSSPCFSSDLLNLTWNGSQNRSWFEPQNWTPCGIPTNLTIVEVPGNLVNYPIFNDNAKAHNVSIMGNGKVEMKGGTLKLYSIE